MLGLRFLKSYGWDSHDCVRLSRGGISRVTIFPTPLGKMFPRTHETSECYNHISVKFAEHIQALQWMKPLHVRHLSYELSTSTTLSTANFANTTYQYKRHIGLRCVPCNHNVLCLISVDMLWMVSYYQSIVLIFLSWQFLLQLHITVLIYETH